MKAWIKQLSQLSRVRLAAASLGLVVIVGVVDWLTGYELSFSVFYLIPVVLAVWFVGNVFGMVVSILCVAVWIAGDKLAGQHYSSSLVLVWNAVVALGFYAAVVVILGKLRKLHRELEERVRDRTLALTNEMRERTRLERELLVVSEREQRRIGHDLHDSLCQHLTGVALAGEVLGEKLAAKSLPEAEATNHLVSLIEEAIDLTRNLARGLHPDKLDGEGFMDAFRELAANTADRLKFPCKLECNQSVVIRDPDTAIHLYRIAQEAINNAINHSQGQQIILRLDNGGGAVTLTIDDDGIGLPEDARQGEGMGLGIMAYRAGMIGATFKIERLPIRGTRVTCTLPAAGGLASESHSYAAKN